MLHTDRRHFLLSSAGALLGASVHQAKLFAQEAKRKEIPWRQVHLDFHTSEHIPGVGADFNAEEFVATLKRARVNSINVFAKCHHGYAYYKTAIARPHPTMPAGLDMLGEMVRVLRREKVEVHAYYSLVWDVLAAREHSEWLMLDADRKPIADRWPWVCMNTPYLDQVLRENEEIHSQYKLNGGWYDILKQPPGGCFCKWCVADRKTLGLGTSKEDIWKHNKRVAFKVEEALTKLVRKHNPEGGTFFNSRLVIGVRDELPYYSHIEIESLPTGGWGYTHFQQRVRYMRTLGKELIGMTGRFHKSWGDFGGLKNQAALDFETLNFLANGARCSVGDQLHPRGRLDAVTYDRIGKAYAKIQALEPWAHGTQGVAEIGVYSSTSTNPDATTQKITEIDQGFTNMLVELHRQFDILDLDSPLDGYKLVILPDAIAPHPKIVAKLKPFLARGGALIASHESLLDPATKQFAMDELGVQYQGPSKFAHEYLILREGAFKGVDLQPYFLYQRGASVTAAPGAEVLATYGHPYFDRSREKFSSHQQTPVGEVTNEPLITRRGKVAYIANPFFGSYATDAFGVQKLVVKELLQQLIGEPILRVDGLPSAGQATLLEQSTASGGRQIVHLLYYPATRRAPNIDIIEEAGLVENVRVGLRTAAKPRKVELVPERKALAVNYANGVASFTVPRVAGHQAIAVEG
ncbi:MAG: alpha-amylase family protein [Bryobacterales bacterium]|nr:alpha-amylase family protein [Bryobacterales bacterium]